VPNSNRIVGADVAAGTGVEIGETGTSVGVGGMDIAVGGGGTGVGVGGTGVLVGTIVGVLLACGVLVGMGVLVSKTGVSVGTWVDVGGNGVCVKVGCGTRVGSGAGTRTCRGPQPQLRNTTSRTIGAAICPLARKFRTVSFAGWMLNNGLSPV
jgi:hypothetical protein